MSCRETSRRHSQRAVEWSGERRGGRASSVRLFAFIGDARVFHQVFICKVKTNGGFSILHGALCARESSFEFILILKKGTRGKYSEVERVPQKRKSRAPAPAQRIGRRNAIRPRRTRRTNTDDKTHRGMINGRPNGGSEESPVNSRGGAYAVIYDQQTHVF